MDGGGQLANEGDGGDELGQRVGVTARVAGQERDRRAAEVRDRRGKERGAIGGGEDTAGLEQDRGRPGDVQSDARWSWTRSRAPRAT